MDTLRVTGRSLVDQSCDAIVELIGQRTLRAGQELPQAAELEEVLGVSRTVIREAISHLMARGVLRRERRRYLVAEPGAQQLTDVLRFRLGQATLTIRDLIELREAVEMQAASLASMRRTDDDVLRIQAAVAAMDAAPDNQTFTVHDIGFHRAIAAASQNPALPIILDALGDLLEEHMRRNLEFALTGGTERDAIVARHQTLAQAIEDADAELTRTLMQFEMDEARRAAHI